MKVIASSVIRSTYRGQSHGGLYVTDFEKETLEQVLDWNYPDIRWDSGGGDRGLRGTIFYGDFLYTSGATYIYKFDKNFQLVNKFDHNCFDGTHEMCIDNDILYTIANQFDAIWLFDLKEEKWLGGFQHIKGRKPEIFSKDQAIEHSDSLHLDIVTYRNGHIWYAGSTTEFLYGFDPFKQNLIEIKLVFPNTHNAQFWKDGIVFNRSIEGETCYQIGEKLEFRWQTPRINRQILTNVLSGDFARTEYTRGMAIQEDMIAIGTSPATIHFFSLENENPIKSCIITTDIRNSICGVSLCPW